MCVCVRARVRVGWEGPVKKAHIENIRRLKNIFKDEFMQWVKKTKMHGEEGGGRLWILSGSCQRNTNKLIANYTLRDYTSHWSQRVLFNY